MNPLRLTSVRALPDVPGADDHLDSLSDVERDQIDGKHINVEVSFAYKALPSGRRAQDKVKNPHLLVEFFTGVKGIWAAPIRESTCHCRFTTAETATAVWVELTGIVGTARARIQLIAGPPLYVDSLLYLGTIILI
jgi:hypothetical protein